MARPARKQSRRRLGARRNAPNGEKQNGKKADSNNDTHGVHAAVGVFVCATERMGTKARFG